MLIAIFAGIAAGRFLKQLCRMRYKHFPADGNPLRRTAIELLSRTVVFPAVMTGIYVALKIYKNAPADLTAVLVIITITYVIYQAIELNDYWIRLISRRKRSTLEEMISPLVRKTLRIVVVLLGAVQIIQQLSDKPITSILAGLGVGGLAVALAAQDTLKNFFGSIVIFSDHPFQVGDRITVDDQDGVVEEVGMRSTRLRTLNGYFVTIPNGDLASKTICNISRRPNIKRIANISLTYNTPPEKVERAIEIIQEELHRKNEHLDPNSPPQAFFNNFTATALNILVVYWFTPADYIPFMKFDQAFNLAILRRFKEEGIEFAFPPQPLFLAGDPKHPVTPEDHYA